jgi:uncharacterized protein
MSREVAFAAAELGMKNTNTSGLLFYGGEPLLEKQLIYDIVDYTKKINKKTGHIFYYKITTNGILLDEEFLKFSRDNNLSMSFSHDGPAQDVCRIFHDNSGSFDALAEKIPMLLKYQPYATGMCVIDPSTVHRAAEIVRFLFDAGFRYITCNMNYSEDAPWTEELLAVLGNEYKKMADMYLNLTRAEEKFYLSPFDIKIMSHIKGDKYHTDRSRFAMNQPSVAPNGKIYTLSRHLNNPAFEIGSVFSGIDFAKHNLIYEKGASTPVTCEECAIKSRCNYVYDILSFDGNDYIPDISPVQCANEQILTPIADGVAQKLFDEKNALFIHKHYNELYPLVSFVEDNG